MNNLARSRARRSRLEMLMDIIASVEYHPGKTITHITYDQSLMSKTVRQLIDRLLDRGILRETHRSTSPSGQRRPSVYYVATEKGRRILRAWRALNAEMEARP